MSSTSPKTFLRLSRRVVRRLGVEEDASADAGRGASVVDADLHRPRRARASGASRLDLEAHIQDILNVIEYEDLRDIVLLGHSYGGMVATGVADRARDRVAQLIYIDAFVPEDGQSLFDLNEPDAHACERPRSTATAGACRRCRRRRIRRLRMSNGSPRAASICRSNVSRQAQAAGRPADIAAQLHLRHAHHAGGHVRAVCQRTKSNPAWRYFEIDASHSPNVTAPEALMALLEKIVAVYRARPQLARGPACYANPSFSKTRFLRKRFRIEVSASL